MREIATATSPEFGASAQGGKMVVLLPVGSVEPHGPHLPLGTDTTISLSACLHAQKLLTEFDCWIAPSLPYGVTDYARSFPGAVSIPAPILTAYLRAIIQGFLGQGARFVCVVNNHLEPAQDEAVRAAVVGLAAAVACPLTRRWGRQLSDEFKHGSCHAGRYETSLVLAAEPTQVQQQIAATLPTVPISLAERIRSGVTEFVAMGLDQAYAGSPSEATVAEGQALYVVLAEMVATEVREGVQRAGS